MPMAATRLSACCFTLVTPIDHNRAGARGNKGMLESLPTLDVRQLQSWQLDEAQAIWRDFQDRTFESFHRCAVDPVRVELDQRIIADLLALPDEAQDTVARLRELLATDPSIHGAKDAQNVLSDDQALSFGVPAQPRQDRLLKSSLRTPKNFEDNSNSSPDSSSNIQSNCVLPRPEDDSLLSSSALKFQTDSTILRLIHVSTAPRLG